MEEEEDQPSGFQAAKALLVEDLAQEDAVVVLSVVGALVVATLGVAHQVAMEEWEVLAEATEVAVAVAMEAVALEVAALEEAALEGAALEGAALEVAALEEAALEALVVVDMEEMAVFFLEMKR